MSCSARLEDGRHRIAVAHELGVAAAEDHVGRVRAPCRTRSRDAHHVADDAAAGTAARAPRPGRPRPARRSPSMTSRADRLDRVEHALELPRRERSGDDAALTGVTRVVHVDERTEELERFGRQVDDRDHAASIP